uniref:BTB domain-containing protein n=1 Tax=Mycena chlorophos TaxID=658473 RepID=A0ABQ0M259_MYCCL|nr:predicted protein [Mycena chlorophos]
MTLLPPQWASTPPPWYGGFSALAAPVVPAISPPHTPPVHSFSAMGHPLPFHRPQPSPAPTPISASPFGGGMPPIPAKNMRPLDRATLFEILEYFSTTTAARFGASRPVRLVIHGGAVFVLNAELSQLAATTTAMDVHSPQQRTTTRDIDYILRSFVAEWAAWGVPDAAQRLKQCILDTAARFGLGADWMNSDADIALPWAIDPVTRGQYDPISSTSMQMADQLTLFTSQNGLLQIISVAPYWTIALKMMRFNAADRADICIILRQGMSSRGIHWTPAGLEYWLLGQTWAMGYANYDPQRVATIRRRMVEVVNEVSRWDPYAPVPLRPSSSMGIYGQQQPHVPGIASPYTSPQSYPPPFVPQQQQQPVNPEQRKKDKKKRDRETTAVTSWPNAWTNASPYRNPYAAPSAAVVPYIPQQSLDPARWAEDVRRAAKKERKTGGKITSWLPFRRRSRNMQEELEHWENVSDGSGSESDSDDATDVDSDEEDENESWLEERRRMWGTSARMPGRRRENNKRRRSRTRTPVAQAATESSYVRVDAGATPGFPPLMQLPGIQHSIASFMSGGMDMENDREHDFEDEEDEERDTVEATENAPGPSRMPRPLTAAASAPVIPLAPPYSGYAQQSRAIPRHTQSLVMPPMQPQPPATWGQAQPPVQSQQHSQPQPQPQAQTQPRGRSGLSTLPSPPRVHPNHPWTYWNHQQLAAQQAQVQTNQHQQHAPAGINGPPPPPQPSHADVNMQRVAARVGALGLNG